jgi:hypothetical protein
VPRLRTAAPGRPAHPSTIRFPPHGSASNPYSLQVAQTTSSGDDPRDPRFISRPSGLARIGSGAPHVSTSIVPESQSTRIEHTAIEAGTSAAFPHSSTRNRLHRSKTIPADSRIPACCAPCPGNTPGAQTVLSRRCGSPPEQLWPDHRRHHSTLDAVVHPIKDASAVLARGRVEGSDGAGGNHAAWNAGGGESGRRYGDRRRHYVRVGDPAQ